MFPFGQGTRCYIKTLILNLCSLLDTGPSGKRQYINFSLVSRPWVEFRSQESNPPNSHFKKSAISTELVLPCKQNGIFGAKCGGIKKAMWLDDVFFG